MRTLFLIACVAVLSSRIADAGLTMDDIIENIRLNESLYANIDVQLEQRYEIGNRRPISFEGRTEVAESSENIRSVSIAEKFRVDVDRISKTGDGSRSTVGASAYDGEVTRSRSGPVVNINHDLVRDPRIIRPHMLVFTKHKFCVPLSVLLSGTEAIKAYSGGRFPSQHVLTAAYEGEETVDGLLCHKIKMSTGHESNPNAVTIFLWVSEVRNYLPLQLQEMRTDVSDSTPMGTAKTVSMKEVSAGIWFPEETTIVHYDRQSLIEKRVPEVRWKTTLLVRNATLNPSVDPDIFTSITIPMGAAVFEVAGGKVVKNWREGMPESPSQMASSYNWIILACLNMAILCVAVALVRRNYSRRTTS